MDLREIKLPSLRYQMGIVMQEPFLFHATIRENLFMADPERPSRSRRRRARLRSFMSLSLDFPRAMTQLQESADTGCQVAKGSDWPSLVPY